MKPAWDRKTCTSVQQQDGHPREPYVVRIGMVYWFLVTIDPVSIWHVKLLHAVFNIHSRFDTLVPFLLFQLNPYTSVRLVDIKKGIMKPQEGKHDPERK